MEKAERSPFDVLETIKKHHAFMIGTPDQEFEDDYQFIEDAIRKPYLQEMREYERNEKDKQDARLDIERIMKNTKGVYNDESRETQALDAISTSVYRYRLPVVEVNWLYGILRNAIDELEELRGMKELVEKLDEMTENSPLNDLIKLILQGKEAEIYKQLEEKE
jgi:hypothetical protein